jgi:glucose-6-phosphate 1-dehydrogenase
MKMRLSQLDFRFDQGGGELPGRLRTLLQDAIQGDASLFARSDEVETAWQIMDPILAGLAQPG